MANYDECESVGVDVKVVERFENRIDRLLRDMMKHNLYLFCGSSATIRYYNEDGKRPLVVGHIREDNFDGGDGAVYEDEDGLERGEGI